MIVDPPKFRIVEIQIEIPVSNSNPLQGIIKHVEDPEVVDAVKRLVVKKLLEQPATNKQGN